MARLEISSGSEFTLVFTSPKYGDVWKRAEGRIGKDNLKSRYTSNVSGVKVRFYPSDEGGESEEIAELGRVFFFDNVDYNVWLEFGNGCSAPEVVEMSRAVEKTYTRHKNGGAYVITGLLNFQNDIGCADFRFRYVKDGISHEVVISFVVLSSKLDYYHDWELVFNDIECKYPMLAADYLKRTYHAFDRIPKTDAPTPDLIWWNLFREEQVPFIKACKFIVSRPRKRLKPAVEYRRADQLRAVGPRIEEEFWEWKHEARHVYRVERDDMSHDTVENRFVKYALRFVLFHHQEIRKKIFRECGRNLSETARKEIDGAAAELKGLLSHPFFRDVGRFTGLRQESAILQRAAGYSTVWRCFGILNASYMLYNGSRRLETKNIADLYEIWCFLKIENIVRVCCGDCEVVENYKMLDDKFVQKLDEGEGSSVIFKKDGVELAKVVYNLNVPFKGIGKADKVRTPTSLTSKSSQKPDIVLRLSKKLGKDGQFKLTYLFDAKYRLADDAIDGVDYPVQENLDQMHRYRDAIYYERSGGSAKPSERLKKEVIGGYVLFPGNGNIPPRPMDGEKDIRPRFLTSIDNVNIGAFPLRPGSEDNIKLLQEFIQGLLAKRPEQEVLETISQKGTT